MNSKPSQCPLCKEENCIVSYGYYGKEERRKKRFKCKRCSKVFSETAGTLHYRMKNDLSKMMEVFNHAFKTSSIRETSRKFNILPSTICKWIKKIEKEGHKEEVEEYIRNTTETKINVDDYLDRFWEWVTKNIQKPMKDNRRRWRRWTPENSQQ